MECLGYACLKGGQGREEDAKQGPWCQQHRVASEALNRSEPHQSNVASKRHDGP